MDESIWFWRGSSFHLSYTVLKGNSSNFRNKGTSFWNFVPESGLWKILPRYIDCRNVIDLARQGGRSERDKRDLRRSAKLTIPPSSDARSIACDCQALSTARDCRAGQLATADTCLERCLQQRWQWVTLFDPWPTWPISQLTHDPRLTTLLTSHDSRLLQFPVRTTKWKCSQNQTSSLPQNTL